MENGKMDISSETLAVAAISLHKPISYFFPAWILDLVRLDDLSPAQEEIASLTGELSPDEQDLALVLARAAVRSLRDGRDSEKSAGDRDG
jgi:hypothetical protein